MPAPSTGLQHPRHAEARGAALGNLVRSLGAQTVLSPAMGGIVMLIVLAVLLPIIQLNTWVK